MRYRGPLSQQILRRARLVAPDLMAEIDFAKPRSQLWTYETMARHVTGWLAGESSRSTSAQSNGQFLYQLNNLIATLWGFCGDAISPSTDSWKTRPEDFIDVQGRALRFCSSSRAGPSYDLVFGLNAVQALVMFVFGPCSHTYDKAAQMVRALEAPAGAR